MEQDLFVHFLIKKQKKNPIKAWWLKPSQRRQKRKAKRRKACRNQKWERASLSHGKKLNEKYMKNNTYGYNL